MTTWKLMHVRTLIPALALLAAVLVLVAATPTAWAAEESDDKMMMQSDDKMMDSGKTMMQSDDKMMDSDKMMMQSDDKMMGPTAVMGMDGMMAPMNMMMDSMMMPAMDLTVTAWRVNVRNGPGLDYAIKVKVLRGDALTAHGRNADGSWLQISYPGGGPDRRWISADLTSITDAHRDSLPVVGVACDKVQTDSYTLSYMSPGGAAHPNYIEGEFVVYGQSEADGELWYKIYYRGERRWLKITDLHNPCGPLTEIAMGMGMSMGMDKDMGMDKGMSSDKSMGMDKDMSMDMKK